MTIAQLDASATTLTGGTRQAAALFVEGLRALSDADRDAAIDEAKSEAPDGPFGAWLRSL
jgi:hypothetical protein